MRNPFFWIWTTCLLLAVIGCQSETDPSTDSAPATQQDAASSSKTAHPEETYTGNILFFGNSLTAGYGLEQVDQAFPNLIQEKIDQNGYGFRVIKAGLSGETTTAGVNRLPWLLKQPIDILIIELGANDGLRGIDPDQTEMNLQAMIDTARALHPNVQIALFGMLVPPNMGQDYAKRFEAVYPRLAKKNQVAYLPFLLDGVAGNPELNLEDGIHPTAEGHRIVANNVWPLIQKLILKQQGKK